MEAFLPKMLLNALSKKMISMKKDFIDILAPGSIRESAKNTHIIEQRNNILSSSRVITKITRS